MKKLLVGLVFCGLSTAALGDNQFSVGGGYPYAGLGVKYAVPINDHTYVYGSVGFMGYSSSDGAGYGYGAGLDIAYPENPRHVLNLIFAGAEWGKTDDDDFRGYGLGYTYHRKGLGQPGWSYGVQILKRNYSEPQSCCTGDHSMRSDDIGLGLSIGYGF